MEQEQKPQERSFINELVPDWRPTREQVLWAVRIVIVIAVVLGLLTLIGLPFGITLWAWVKLLIVPAVLAAGGLWFNRQQRDREMEIAEQRGQDEALQAYLDGMSQLLTDKDQPLHQTPPGDILRMVAQARTLTVLRRLDGERKGRVLQFLHESRLVSKVHGVLDLKGADLSGIDLLGTHVDMADLPEDLAWGVWETMMWGDVTPPPTASKWRWSSSEAAFRSEVLRLVYQRVGALARAADLSEADLREANLIRANLSVVALIRADLSRADLREAKLLGANLSGANLYKANLFGANLIGADLSGTEGITNEELELQAYSLKGAILPDGQRYEDWLWSKGSREDGENTGPS